jgi:hypothetical protein
MMLIIPMRGSSPTASWKLSILAEQFLLWQFVLAGFYHWFISPALLVSRVMKE